MDTPPQSTDDLQRQINDLKWEIARLRSLIEVVGTQESSEHR